mgnify:CR=1 FL=1
MTGDLDDLSDAEQRLCAALAAYFEAVQAGQAPEREAWLARYPDLADELTVFLEDEERLLRMTESLGAANGSAIPPGRPSSKGNWAPHTFGDYELLDEIARGGMGIVYRARQRSLNRQVALKLLPGGVPVNDEDARRFRLEAEAVARLDHPNIVPIFEVGEHYGHSYFSMKLIECGSLAQAMTAKTVDTRAAARLVATVSRAIHHAHQRGVLHRDLKPSNILMDAAGQPHVTDFGLAKRIEDDSDLTLSGAILGTPSYMAPEQASGKKNAVTVATDVYGLGAVLYALLVGKPPFEGGSVLETLEQVRTARPEPPSSRGAKMDRDLETICLKCLEKGPEGRYDSALALAEDLERWLRGDPILARPVGRLRHAWRWYRKEPLAASLVALVLGLMMSGLAGLFLGNRVLVVQRDDARKNLAEARLQRQRSAYNFSLMLERAAQLVERLRESAPNEGPEQLALRSSMTEQSLDLIRIYIKDYANDPNLRIETVYAHRVLGSLYAEIRTREESYAEFGQAMRLAEALVADHPDIAPYRVELGRIHDIVAHHHDADGKAEEADVEYRRALSEFLRAVEVEPTNANALNFVAWQLAQDMPPRYRDPARAVRIARQAVAVAEDQEAPRVWNTLGIAYYRAGDWRAAAAALKKACELRPGDGNDHDFFALAMALWRLGERPDARRWYDRGIAWNLDHALKPERAPLFAEATAVLGLTRADDRRP